METDNVITPVNENMSVDRQSMDSIYVNIPTPIADSNFSLNLFIYHVSINLVTASEAQ